jgi:hypothetical protein
VTANTYSHVLLDESELDYGPPSCRGGDVNPGEKGPWGLLAAAARADRGLMPRLLTVLKLVAFVAVAWLLMNVVVFVVIPGLAWLLGVEP